MKLIYNKIIPFKGFKAINLFGFVFVREGAIMKQYDINHEAIHTAQMKEMLFIPYYLWYVIEWLIRLIIYLDFDTAYRNISFEREAYRFQNLSGYLENRHHYRWIKYIIIKKIY